MSMLARIPMMCNDEVHYISVWEPGDELLCGAEHVIYATNGNIICYENHDAELELTISDLTGTQPDCIAWMNTIDGILYNGILSKDTELTKFCVFAGANVNIGHGTPLRYAVMRNQYKIAELLITHGASITYGMGEGFEPIIHAAKYGRPNIAKLLIKHGADPNIYQYQSLIEATRNGNLATTKIFLKYNPPYNSVLQAKALALAYGKMKTYHYLQGYLKTMEWKKP
jgi:ankyrin repeat protein